MAAIPELLLSVPTPTVEPQHVHDNKLHLSVGQAQELCKAYCAEVAQFLRVRRGSLEHDVVPAVELALRLYNAENYSGELIPVERAQFAAVFERFGYVAAQTTPPEASDSAGAESAAESEEVRLRDAYLQRLLTVDGEMPSPCVRLPGLLLCLFAFVMATEGGSGPGGADYVVPLTCKWRLRVLLRYQYSLQHRAHFLFTQVSACIDAIMAQPDDDVSVETLLEVGHAQNYYHRRELSAETFRRAAVKSGLLLEESAMLGVRTRWQQHQVVQMVLCASSTRPVPPDSTTEEQPKTVMSEKDGHDLLDRPREQAEAEPETLTPLHPEDKAIILALCDDIRNNNPYHGLTRHHILTYVERVLTDPSPAPFMIRCQLLLLRARLESRRNRVQERAFLQMTELVDQFSSRRDPTHATFERTKSTYFYSVAYPSVWSLKREYADFCFEENLYKTALDMYEQILDWEKIIECCKKLDKRKRAESLARELLEKDPENPMLWVALGEATREDRFLWKAWELSHHQMAAPMRALARLALERERYEEVVQFFDEAVRINPVFGGDWFTLGYASLKLHNWARSGVAFTRVCQIDPNDAFAWNNLASIMLRDGKLRPAFNAMSQALRNNRRNWRMWQNYFQIGCELHEVLETTNALNITLDIAKRQVQLPRDTMDLFVDNTIAYLKGEIAGSTLEAEDAATSKKDNVRYKSMGDQNMPDEESLASPVPPLAALPVTAASEAEDAEGEFDELVPLGGEVEMPASFFPARDAALAAQEETIRAEVRRRHRDRVRQLFQRLLDTFVDDPDLYECAARLFDYLDGPLVAFRYRQKELRACQQKDQWDRTPALFKRTVECLTSMASTAAEALTCAKDAMEHPPAALPTPAPSASPPSHHRDAHSANEEGEDQTEAASPPQAPAPGEAAVVPPSPPTDWCSEETRAAVINALKEALNNISTALEVSEENMEATPEYAHLLAESKKARKALQEAKAAFV